MLKLTSVRGALDVRALGNTQKNRQRGADVHREKGKRREGEGVGEGGGGA